MRENMCINKDCEYHDEGSDTGCCADLSTWEDCDLAEFNDEDN